MHAYCISANMCKLCSEKQSDCGVCNIFFGGEGFATEFITNLYQNKLKYVLGSYMFVHNSKFLHVCLIKCYLADQRKEMRHIWAQTKIF